MKEMIDLIRNRRTVRKYRTEQIKEEELEKILEAGLCAPSAGNMQRVKIVALQNREISDHLGRINVSVMKRPASAHVSDEQPSIIDDPSNPSGFYNAPTVCIIFNRKEGKYSISDSFCTAENMILEATDLGVASAIIGRAEETFESEYGRTLMDEWGIEPDYTARCFVLLGYIDGVYPSMKPRKENRVRTIR